MSRHYLHTMTFDLFVSRVTVAVMSSERLEECERDLKIILEELQSEIYYKLPSNYGGR